MLKKRIILSLSFYEGVLHRTKIFKPDYRYTMNFVDLWLADEIVLLDVSNVKLKESFINILKHFSKNCFVPITVGGGISSIEDAKFLFTNGADKIILNTISNSNPQIIRCISDEYGSQSIIHSVDCRRNADNYEVYINNGKNKSYLNLEQWINQAVKYGAGELLINNIDRDGSLIGFDIKLINLVKNMASVPIIALGGAGQWQHFEELFRETNISGGCTQNIYHFTNKSLFSLKSYLTEKKINIRL
jgi:cyclase